MQSIPYQDDQLLNPISEATENLGNEKPIQFSPESSRATEREKRQITTIAHHITRKWTTITTVVPIMVVEITAVTTTMALLSIYNCTEQDVF